MSSLVEGLATGSAGVDVKGLNPMSRGVVDVGVGGSDLPLEERAGFLATGGGALPPDPRRAWPPYPLFAEDLVIGVGGFCFVLTTEDFSVESAETL